MSIKIQSMKKQEIKKVAEIASQCFSGMKDIKKATRWVICNFRAFPRARYFVAKENKKIIGYILWLEKGGFRKHAVFELEQIAVDPTFRGREVGTKLIKASFREIKNSLKKRGSFLKLVEVTTGVENQAQKLYKKTLKAKPEAVIKDFFRGDEVIMLTRF